MPPPNPTLEAFRLAWVAQYMPTHDHRFPPVRGPHTERDYWLGALGDFSTMSSEIRLP